MKKNITIIGLTVAVLLLGLQAKGLNNSIQLKEEKIEILEKEYEELSKYRFYDIPLTYKQQKFVFDLAEEKDLSFELLISIMKNESDFRTNLVSKTSDYGIMQLNLKNHDFFAKLSGLEEYDVFDFYDNVTMGVNYLVYLRNNLIKQGITNQEDLTIYLLNSYNMGEMGFKNYVKRTGMTTRVYNQNIIEYKGLLEQSLNT